MADEQYSFGAWMRLRRQALVLSREDLARAVGVAEVTLRKIEADERRPSPQVAALLAQQLQFASELQGLFVQVARGLLPVDQLPPPIPGSIRVAAASTSTPAAAPVTTPAPLPSGTVTFLFTDIAGSTRLWEQHPQAMPAALARHDALLRNAIAAHGGQVFKTVGDAVCAVFGHAPNALAAALEAQRTLHTESWGATGPLRVRMALHTGTVLLQDGEYAGYALSRVARLLAAGHGGQILVSQSAQALVRNHLPPATQLHDLGVYQLKDIVQPEPIAQLVAPDLVADFPPLHAARAHAGNLPTQLTSLIGREHELGELITLLRQSPIRLITLTGPGGTGKTRLALAVAAALTDAYPDGAWFVDLAPVTDPAQVAATIARELGAAVLADKTPLEVLAAFLRDQRRLVILDNFEQVLDAAPVCVALLRAVPGLTLLVTSRAALHLAGEQAYAVPPLALPDPQDQTPLEQLTQYDAVRLFIARAQAVRPSFQVTNANAPAVAAICSHLDGLPLAIELAAARSTLFTPEALLARLVAGGRLPQLVGGARDLPQRQQTIRSTIAWSYDLLDAAARTVFAQLAVFAGGWTLAAAEAVWLGGAGDMLTLLESLAAQSLVQVHADGDGEPRFRMLETIREYAQERLAEAGDLAMRRHQHAEYCLALVEQAEPKLRSGEQITWLKRMDIEYDNLHTALEWSFAAQGDTNQQLIGLRLAGALWYYWLLRDAFVEWRSWTQLILASVEQLLDDTASAVAPMITLPPVHGRVCVKALISIVQLAPVEIGPTQALASRSIALARQAGDRALLAYALLFAGHAAEDFREGLECARAVNNHWLICEGLESLAWKTFQSGDGTTALMLAEESLCEAQLTGDPWRIHHSLLSLGRFHMGQGDLATARILEEESLAIARALPNQVGVASALYGLMEVAEGQGDFAMAFALNEERLIYEQRVDNTGGVAYAIAVRGLLAGVQGAYTLAQEHFAQSLALFQELVSPPMLIWFLFNRASMMGLDHGDYAQSSRDLEAALALAYDEDDRYWMAFIRREQGILALAQGDLSTAQTHLEESRRLGADVQSGPWGYKWALGTVLEGLGQLARRQGKPQEAVTLLRESLEILRTLWKQPVLGTALLYLGQALLDTRELAEARTRLSESLTIFRHMGARQRIAWTLEGCAGVAAAQAQPTRAARLWGAAATLRAAIGAPMWPVDRSAYEQRVATARAQLPSEVFDAAWAAGQALTWEQAIAEALGEADHRAPPAPDHARTAQ